MLLFKGKKSITNYMVKIKPAIIAWVESEKGKDLLIIIIVILAGLFSFELGRLSKTNGSSGIQIEYTEEPRQSAGYQEASVINSLKPALKLKDQSKSAEGKNYFASSRGSKYYSAGCSAGKTIKQENRVYFDTSEQAEQAGYTLSSSCN
jgi:hypothetical protein